MAKLVLKAVKSYCRVNKHSAGGPTTMWPQRAETTFCFNSFPHYIGYTFSIILLLGERWEKGIIREKILY